jgi:hypothetical protein
MSKRPRVLLCTGLAVALGLSACGGDDKTVSADSAGSVTSDTASTDTASSETKATGSDDTTEVTEGSGIPGVSKLCAEGVAAIQAMVIGMGGTATGELGSAAEGMAKLADSLPDDLKDDAETLATFFAGYSKLLAQYGNDISKVIGAAATDPELKKALAELSSPEMSTATANLGAYFNSNCKTT